GCRAPSSLRISSSRSRVTCRRKRSTRRLASAMSTPKPVSSACRAATSTRARDAVISRRDWRKRARPVDELDLVRGGRNVPAGAGERDLQLLAACGMASEDGWALGVGLVAIPPLPEREQDRHQLATLVGQAVFLARPAAGLAVL